MLCCSAVDEKYKKGDTKQFNIGHIRIKGIKLLDGGYWYTGEVGNKYFAMVVLAHWKFRGLYDDIVKCKLHGYAVILKKKLMHERMCGHSPFLFQRVSHKLHPYISPCRTRLVLQRVDEGVIVS